MQSAKTVIFNSYDSPLRYPGGKGMLADFVITLLSASNMVGCDYVEVYAGGAGIALTLLLGNYVQHIHINDLSRPVYAFWKSVMQHTDELCRLIHDTPITMDEWYRQRAVQIKPRGHSLLELGFSTFYLNRTNRSGILRGGVIGGKSQSGKWKMDARFNKRDLIGRIRRVALFSSRVSVYNLDASQFIRKRLPRIPKRSLVYLDPPYYGKGKGLYENHYSAEDHVRIAKQVSSRIRQPWIVSYDNTPQVAALYAKFRSLEYHLSYSAQHRYAGSEIMFFSDGLIIPNLNEPAQAGIGRSPINST